MRSFTERVWKTEAGPLAIVTSWRFGDKVASICGHIAVPEGHPLFGKNVDFIAYCGPGDGTYPAAWGGMVARGGI